MFIRHSARCGGKRLQKRKIFDALEAAGTAVAEIGTALAGMAVLALGYSGERSQRLPITVATTTAMIMRLMPVHPHLRFGIGAMPIRATTLRYPNAPFRGDQLFSNGRRQFLAHFAET